MTTRPGSSTDRQRARLLVLREGHVAAESTPGQVLTPSLIKQVYDVQADVTHGPGHPVIRTPRRPAPPGPAGQRWCSEAEGRGSVGVAVMSSSSMASWSGVPGSAV